MNLFWIKTVEQFKEEFTVRYNFSSYLLTYLFTIQIQSAGISFLKYTYMYELNKDIYIS